MQTKLLEIRDRATFIPVMATAFTGDEHHLFRAAGYARRQRYVMVVKLTGGHVAATYDPFQWNDLSRTMQEAHIFIENNWQAITDGQVIDVEFILGETAAPKTPQHLDLNQPY